MYALNGLSWISLCACCSLFLFVEATEMHKLPGSLKIPPGRNLHLKGRQPCLRFLSCFPRSSHVPPGKHDYVHSGYVWQLFSLEMPWLGLGRSKGNDNIPADGSAVIDSSRNRISPFGWDSWGSKIRASPCSVGHNHILACVLWRKLSSLV